MRTEHDATMTELRSAGRTLTSAAGALLAERLAATAGNLTTGLGAVRTLAKHRHLAAHDLVHCVGVGLDSEDAICDLHGALRLTSGVGDIESCH